MHNDQQSNTIHNPIKFIAMFNIHFMIQQLLHCQPEYFLIIHISGLEHIDTSDPTCNRADLVYHATQSLWRIWHIWLNTSLCWPCLSCHPHITNPSLWHCNRILISGSLWKCSVCMHVHVYQHIHKSLNSQTIDFHQVYIIILTQHFNHLLYV